MIPLTLLRNKLDTDGGFTVRVDGLNAQEYITSGWAVSPYPEAEKVIDAKSVGSVNLVWAIGDFIWKHRELLAQPNAYLGGWFDREDNKVYLDVSIVVDDKDKAVEIAQDHNQLAIFDLVDKETHRV